MKTNPTKCSLALLILWVVPLLVPSHAFADGSDNFDDNDKDSSKWGNDVVTGGVGVLTEKNGRLEFTANSALTDGDTLRPWILERFPVGSNWTIQVDTFNNTTPAVFGQINSGGLTLLHPTQNNSGIYHELYAVNGGFKGFVSALETDENDVANIDTSAFLDGTVMAAVRMEYDALTQVVTCFYDTNTVDGYQWIQNASFGLNNAGGADANTDWNLSADQQFSVWVYGFAEFMTIASGQLYLDNFLETGGEPSDGGPVPTPVPTGNFSFGFPTDNPSLIAIASITGNYTGLDPFRGARNYDIDIAQDEKGKVIAMGVADGIENDEGGSEIDGLTGTVKTVNGKPQLDARASFNGTTDDAATSGSGRTSAPVEFTDIGGGSNGVAATTSGSGSVDGIPGSVSSMPVLIPATEDMENNFSKDWTLNLVITNMTIKGKETLTASATLIQPNGDMIEFPPKKVKYKEAQGFKVSLSKGMNVSVNPPAKTKSKLAISGMTMQQVGEEWTPTGGIISYQFLGQKGIADLLDFDMP